MDALLVKQLGYRAGKFLLWQGYSRWKKDNKKIVSKFESIIDSLWTSAIGTIDDWFGGGFGESQYKWWALPSINKFDKVYDQTEFSNIIWGVGCFWYGNINNVALNLWVTFTKKEREDFVKDLIKIKSYKPQWGWNFLEWADVTNVHINKKKVEYIRYYFSINLFTLNKALDQGYHIAMPLNISQNILKWLFDDWVLKASEVSWKTSFGHLANFAKNSEGKIVMWTDNYPDSKDRNVFEVESIDALYRSGRFMRTARFYAPIKDMKKVEVVAEEIKLPEMKIDNYKMAVKYGFISDKDPSKSIRRDDLGRVIFRSYLRWLEDMKKYVDKEIKKTIKK